MKRFVSTLAVLGTALMPFTAMAATLVSGQQYSLPAQKFVEGNLYAVAGTSIIGGRVTGDVLTVGGTISLAGTVDGDVFAVGGTLQVLGAVAGDVRAAGGTLTLNDRIGGDLVVAGGTVHLLSGAVVQGDVLVAGGQVVIDGMVQGSVRMTGGQLAVNGTVSGDVRYRAREEIRRGADAVIGGSVVRTEIKSGWVQRQISAGFLEGSLKGALWAAIAIMTGMELLAALGLAAVLMWRWRRQSLDVLAETRSAFWSSVGRGIVYGVLVPVASVLLLVSFIGALPGVLALLAFVAVAVLTKAMAGMLAGSWLMMVVKKRSTLSLTWGTALGGVVLLRLFSLIPIVGWIVDMLATIAVFGVLAHRIHRQLSLR